ncbi:lipopolysaccharide-induced tumor necrosis factor-alpha factor homolog isoform X2 [Odontomachus brunneus]|nr:lipopolysaccharide-induced tumor necrosis factor-alpha factor homolog isoform X2 [Odontomachus brunneus]
MSTSSVENTRRVTDVENIEQVSELYRSEAYSSSHALYYSPAGRSLPQIDRSYHGRRLRRRRRWKLANCFRRTPSDVPSSRDAPPTYSSMYVDLISHSARCSSIFPINNRSPATARIPPPSYAQTQGIHLAASTNHTQGIHLAASMEPFITLSPRSSWPRVPTATICPRCAAFVITAVVVRRSTYSHLTALTLFLLGCWPCCMIPYCIDSCNSMDHYCPLCHAHLGTHAP